MINSWKLMIPSPLLSNFCITTDSSTMFSYLDLSALWNSENSSRDKERLLFLSYCLKRREATTNRLSFSSLRIPFFEAIASQQWMNSGKFNALFPSLSKNMVRASNCSIVKENPMALNNFPNSLISISPFPSFPFDEHVAIQPETYLIKSNKKLLNDLFIFQTEAVFVHFFIGASSYVFLPQTYCSFPSNKWHHKPYCSIHQFLIDTIILVSSMSRPMTRVPY